MRTILLAEKETFLSGIYGYRLRDSGFLVIPSADGVDALNKFDSEDIDLVLLNELFPSVSGHEILRRIRSHASPEKRRVPVIMLADSADSASVDQGLALGASKYAFKNTHTPAEIILSVKKLL